MSQSPDTAGPAPSVPRPDTHAPGEAALRQVFDALPILISFVDRDLVYRFANKAYESWIGRRLDQIIGHHVRDIFGEAGFQQRVPAMQRALAGTPSRIEVPYRRDDGAERQIELRYLPRQAADGTIDGLHIVAVDVTDRARAEQELRGVNETLESRVADRTRALAVANDQLQAEMLNRERTQEQLRQSQKMEAVGQLTGGIAHDFNNILTGMIGNLELMQFRIAQGRGLELGGYVSAAIAAANRAAGLTHRLLAFARRQTLDSRPTDVNRLVQDMAELIRRTVGPAITLEIVPDPGLWTTFCDRNQLESALLNLCLNARDAMPEGGQLRIETVNRVFDTDKAARRDLPPGDYVALRVTDTGLGMTPEVMARVFDPFFTTKPLGQGTGLGLSMIYGFTRQSGGQVRLQSRPGEGTRITLLLPRHDGAAEPEYVAGPLAQVLQADPKRAAVGETVLVIDDEPMVRMLVVEVLSELGYAAIQGDDAASGLDVLRSDQRVDLLISDVGLPGGMDGCQLAAAAQATRPGLGVLLITGYADNATLDCRRIGPNVQIMTKPFPMEALASKVKAMLSADSV